MRNLRQAILSFGDALKRTQSEDRSCFVIKHTKNIGMLMETCRVSSFKQGEVVHKLQTLIDTIFKPLLLNKVSSPQEYVQHFVTDVFYRFMQGITIFTGDNVIGKPAYHRLQSCGPRDGGPEYNIANLNCGGVADGTGEHSRRSRNVWNCAIERMVYDQIFSRLTDAIQDHKHAVQMVHINRTMLETCYPFHALHLWNVEVEFDSGLNHCVPAKCIVEFSVQPDPIRHTLVREEYTHEYFHPNYATDVQCVRSVSTILHRGFTRATTSVRERRIDEKVQSFFNKVGWPDSEGRLGAPHFTAGGIGKGTKPS